jgi:microcystin-dependent protein
MSGTTGTIPLNTVVVDQLITSAERNAELANIGALLDASGAGGHSDTDADAQIQTAPFPGSVLSNATSIAGELERLRYQLAQILGTDYWYKPAATDLTVVGNVVVPLGGVIDYPVATAPNAKWHLADGTAISRVTYATLFALIGTTFGAGDTTTTFNLPDYRDRMSIGAGTTYALAATGGEATHVLTTPEMPSHTHTATSVVTDSGHQHKRSKNQNIHVDNTGSTSVDVFGSPTALDGASLTSVDTTGVTVATTNTNTGGGGAHNNLPYLGMYKLIRIL